jgi:hypothetical protein
MVRGTLLEFKQKNINEDDITMVIIGSGEPWWQRDDKIMLCELDAALLGVEAVIQVVALSENNEPLAGRVFEPEVEHTGEQHRPLRVLWQ